MEHTKEPTAMEKLIETLVFLNKQCPSDSKMGLAYAVAIDNAREQLENETKQLSELRETMKELRVEAERAHLHAVANGHFETAKRLLILLTRSKHLS